MSFGQDKRMTFIGKRGSVTIPGNKVRSMLGLSSTLFEIQIGPERPDKLEVPITNRYGYQIGEKTIPIREKDQGGTAVGDLRLFSDVPGEKVTFTGGGWGRGVGLSQWGARGMALSREARGKKDYYKTILAHYYPGIRVEKEY